MWHSTISVVELLQASTWKPEQFRALPSDPTPARECTVRLGELVAERNEFANPTSARFAALPYLGLDAIEPGSGRVLFIRSAAEQAIHSRSKVFREGDVLYGR